jgi:hypothetical protein
LTVAPGGAGLVAVSGLPTLLGDLNSTNVIFDDDGVAALINKLKGSIDNLNKVVVGEAARGAGAFGCLVGGARRWATPASSHWERAARHNRVHLQERASGEWRAAFHSIGPNLAARSAGTSTAYLTGSVGEPGTTDAAMPNPVRMKETNLGNLFCDALIWWLSVRGKGPEHGAVLGGDLHQHAHARQQREAHWGVRVQQGAAGRAALRCPIAPAVLTKPTASLDTPTQTSTTLLSENAIKGLPVAAIYNGGGIRASSPAGTLTQGDLAAWSPFGNWAVVKRVSAADVVASLQNGVSKWDPVDPAGRFPQVRAGSKYAQGLPWRGMRVGTGRGYVTLAAPHRTASHARSPRCSPRPASAQPAALLMYGGRVRSTSLMPATLNRSLASGLPSPRTVPRVGARPS